MDSIKTPSLHFDVSSGLKTVLGSELITDDEVAIFELVKNSFDAEATLVEVYFNDDCIVVADNGLGMSFEDIRNKWLFVAYSSKRTTNRDYDFRENIAERRHYAGSKGIGRFSSDRLGKSIILQTRPRAGISGPVYTIAVDWSQFDKNHRVKFETIGVDRLPDAADYSVPEELSARESGTVITISKLREKWDRTKILRIKSALAKLINPFGASTDGFQILIYAPNELLLDNLEKQENNNPNDEPIQNGSVNGQVGNFIFATLQDKTTFISVSINPESNQIESSLIDRGELIYRVLEPNPYETLRNSGFQCQLFFLNQSAKITFARRMGVPSVQFGSVFLFRNGFRVFPIGEDGDDWFKMDRRKAQGFRRFLGTRDVIGRIDVSGADDDFQEASSRNTGLIETAAVLQLRKCFHEYGLKRLERYIVPVTYVDKEDKVTGDVSRLQTDPGKARVASAIAKLIDNDDIQLIEYSKKLVGILNERSAQFEGSLVSLRAIAEKTRDKDLFSSITTAEQRFEELRRSEEAAKRQADQERSAKIAAEARAQEAESAVAKLTVHLDEERKRSLFLTAISSLDTETILNLHHQITIYSVDMQQQIENSLLRITGKATVSTIDVINTLERLALLNRKIMGISKFATRANFRLESEKIEADLGDYIEQYINDVALQFLMGSPKVIVNQDNKGFIQKFKPIDISVVIDNLIANARKKQVRATQIGFEISHPNKHSVHIRVTDNGKGFDDSITNLDDVFSKGFTRTDGSGLGLYHVRHVLGEMNGTIEALRRQEIQGAEFLIRISK